MFCSGGFVHSSKSRDFSAKWNPFELLDVSVSDWSLGWRFGPQLLPPTVSFSRTLTPQTPPKIQVTFQKPLSPVQLKLILIRIGPLSSSCRNTLHILLIVFGQQPAIIYMGYRNYHWALTELALSARGAAILTNRQRKVFFSTVITA